MKARSDYEWLVLCRKWREVKRIGEVTQKEFAREMGCHRATLSGKYRAWQKEHEC